MSSELSIPTGEKCDWCLARYTDYNLGYDIPHYRCGLAAIWGEPGMGEIELINEDKSKACLEETRFTPTIITISTDLRRK